MRNTVFPGTTDIDQLSKIFTIRGNVDTEKWKDVDLLPNYIEFKQKDPVPMNVVFPTATPECQDLLEKMLQLNPNDRPTVDQCLNHPYFTQELPKMSLNTSIPLPKKKGEE